MPFNFTDLWDGWAHVAPGMLKQIKGGNLNGKSDINPVWRFRALTEAFGPCGLGWTVTEVERWKDEAAGEIACSVKVHLRLNLGGVWSEPIEGVGGSKLCGKGRGEGINDEAWKMATTDAISVACKSLGIAADVYTGKQSHADADQRKDGPDYGTKYEPRNYGAGNYSNQGQRSQNSRQSAHPAAPSAPAPSYAPPKPEEPAPQPARRKIILATVTTGRCTALIEALSRHDPEVPEDWNRCLDSVRAKFDIDDDALNELANRAIALRFKNEFDQTNDLP